MRWRAPRIYYVSPLLIGPRDRWLRLLDRVQRLGFDTMLTAPPFRTGRADTLFHPASLDRLHPALAEPGDDAAPFVAWLVKQTAARGIDLMLDLSLTLSADADIAAAERNWFEPDPSVADRIIDPRWRLRRHVAMPRFADPALRPKLTAWFAERIGSWAAAGIRGFRCLGPQEIPVATWHNLIAAAKQASPSTVFCAWTPGLSVEAVDQLAEAGFDLSFASTPWWDHRATWLVEEYEARRLTAPSIGLVEEPAGRRLAEAAAHLPDLKAVAARRLRAAAWLGFGYLMPMGFEFGAVRALDVKQAALADWDALAARPPLDLQAEITALNRFLQHHPVFAANGQMRQLTGERAAATVVLRADRGHLTAATQTALLCLNPESDRGATLPAGSVLPGLAGLFAPPVPADERDGALMPTANLDLPPAGTALYLATRFEPPSGNVRTVPATRAAASPRVVIERVTPGWIAPELAAKRLAGEAMVVEADIFSDGHELLRAELLWRPAESPAWQGVEMQLLGNDRWRAAFPLTEAGRYVYTIEAWRDEFGSWRDEFEKKRVAGLDVSLELMEGRELVQHAAAASNHADLKEVAARLEQGELSSILLADGTTELMRMQAPRTQATRADAEYGVAADRSEALFASWYELFPRSATDSEDRHATFDDVTARLPAIRRMGFDVLYMPPIHPIGRTNRKGRNNALKVASTDPGSPYAIGAAEGGHDAVHPDLGGLPAFRRLVAAAAEHGMEVALDFAIQCAPDHPWLKQHPRWFDWRPDGSLKYAENPPKRYEDIVNVDFYQDGAVPGLWHALRDVILFWVGEGVRTFRVDNPHTKPLPFWQWMIAEVQRAHPDVIFLSEAFTRPAMMRRLAKVGFTQSYTYFTWRNGKAELTEYLTELTTSEMRDYYRPHFFVNTPDINPFFLQTGGRPAFLIRAALAATLSGLWGMYNGFELCEVAALPGREEYLDSEKYQIRAWDWGRPGNIIADITRLNRIRRENPALQTHLGLGFLNCWDENLLCYRKMTPSRDNLIVVAVNLDPFAAHGASFEVPLWDFELPDDASVAVDDLIRDTKTTWTGKIQPLHLDPRELPYAIWRIAPLGHVRG